MNPPPEGALRADERTVAFRDPAAVRSVTIVAGQGPLGGALVESALREGCTVTVLGAADGFGAARGVRVVPGSPGEPATLRAALADADAVLLAPQDDGSSGPAQESALGPGEGAVASVLDAMASRNLRRLVVPFSAALVAPGDRVSLLRRAAMPMKRARRDAAARAEARGFMRIHESDLEWTLVRAERVVAGAATGRFRVSDGRMTRTTISFGDLAHFMLRCARGALWVGRAPFIGQGGA